MTITLYHCSEDPKTIRKNPTIIGVAKPIAPTGIVSRDLPVITIDYAGSFTDANYMYIDTFERFYYVSVAVNIAGKIVLTATSCDVLKSFEADLFKVPVTVVRSETAGINEVVDSQLPISQEKIKRRSIPLSNDLFNTQSASPYVLTVIGGNG